MPLHNAYYNENDAFAAAWLRNLIEKGLVARGEVDTRDIRDVQSEDLRGFRQCHFFAGIGGWSFAFRLAGLPDDFPAWSGSCPCQPFSTAGKQKGAKDERHLWPDWFRLICECRPPKIFGEQVANAVGHGWLDAVADDLESEGYALGAAVLPACAVGAPHRRDRLWFVADAKRLVGHERRASNPDESAGGRDANRSGICKRNVSDRLRSRLPDARPVSFRADGNEGRGDAPSSDWWSVESRLGRVAHGIPNRVGKLRGYGNAIVPQIAAEFIAAAMECAP